MADPIRKIDPSDVGESGPAFLLDHSDPAGVPRPDVWRQAIADFYQLDLDASVLWSQIGPAPLVVNGDQIFMGTGPDSGEVTDILIDSSGASDQTIYITTDDGGIWKTIDAGNTWRPLTDQMFSISMGAIAMDPANNQILYGGSGNLFDGGSAFTKNAGIYRSADAGLTWSIVDGGYFGTLFVNLGISRIVCPVPDCLLVATNQGLYRSVDGGRNFGANAPNFDDRQPVVPGNICCLLLDTATPASTVYCGVAGNSVDNTGNPLPNVGLLKSTNAGISFPTNLFSPPTAPQIPYGTFVVAQSAFDRTTANSSVLYASVQTNLANGTSSYVGLFRSTDSGTTWAQFNNLSAVASKNVPGDTNGAGFTQTTYDLTLGVDPINSQRVYAGFQQIWLSADGGVNFQPAAITASQVHWDNHALVFSPATHRPVPPAAPAPIPPTILYTGTDGGIATSNDGGQSWSPINGGIATNLFRGIDIGKGATDTGKGVPNTFTYGGCQDTGTSGHRPADVAGEWHAGINGDGWLVAVDPTDPTIVYGFDDQYFIKTTDAGATWQASYNSPVVVGNGLTNPSPSYARAIALEQTGINPAARTVYVSEGRVILKSTDSGLNFAATPLAPGDFVTCIVTTSAAGQLIWAGSFDGAVHCSLDGGATWDAAPLNTTPGGAGILIGPVNSIAIDPTNTQRIAVVYGGVSAIYAKYRTRHVFLSIDGGANWADVSGTDGSGPVGNVPDLTLRSVVFDTSATPAAIVVAGDAGVLRSIDATITGTGSSAVGTATWKIYGAGLPMVCCNSLAIDNSVAPPVLRVGTYGRSCYEVTRPTGGPSFASDNNLAFGVVATGQSVTLPFYVYNCGDASLDISAGSVIGPGPFTFGAAPPFPVSIAVGATQAFQITYAPTAPGDDFVLLQLTTNDPTQATRTIPASSTAVNTGLLQRLATNPIASVGFGTVTTGTNRTIPVQLFNVGTVALNIASITLTSGSADFSLNPAPAFPIAIPPGGESDITVQFAPSGSGALTAEFTIASDDPHAPLKLNASGTGFQVASGFWTQFLTLLGIAHP
jgi:Abnormal spindle-like microcephaly-assoc'd, ASPM-SPD-2-Hydin